MNRLVDANPKDAMRLEADLENLQNQLKEHRRTFERGDESEGVGYVAAEGYADVHDHYNGKLNSDEFLSTTKKYGKEDGNDYSAAVEDLYDLLLDPDIPLVKTDAKGNPIVSGKTGKPKQKSS